MMNIFYSIGSYVAERINIFDLMSSFRLMGQGMLGIFIVMSAIAFVVYLLTKVSAKNQ